MNRESIRKAELGKERPGTGCICDCEKEHRDDSRSPQEEQRQRGGKWVWTWEKGVGAEEEVKSGMEGKEEDTWVDEYMG